MSRPRRCRIRHELYGSVIDRKKMAVGTEHQSCHGKRLLLEKSKDDMWLHNIFVPTVLSCSNPATPDIVQHQGNVRPGRCHRRPAFAGGRLHDMRGSRRGGRAVRLAFRQTAGGEAMSGSQMPWGHRRAVDR